MTSTDPSPSTTPRRVWEILTQEGPRSLYFKILGETVYRRLVLMEKNLHGPAPVPLKRHLDCRPLLPEELGRYAAFKVDTHPNTILGRLERGDTCFVVWENGRIIHSCWTATGRTRIDYLDCEVVLAADAVYVYEVYTSPRHRGRSVSSARSARMQQFFLNRQLRRLVAAVGPENRAALRSAEKAGYGVVGRIGYRGRGRFKRHFCHYAGENPGLRLL